MTNDELLNTLTNHIDEILPRLAWPVERYRQTIDGLVSCNVATDQAYRRNFIRFYQMRLPRAKAYDDYFDILERLKGQQDIDTTEVLAVVLEELQIKTGRIESSFASKLIATLNPNLPVVDSIVLSNMGIRLPAYNASARKEKVIAIYRELTTRLNQMIQDKRFIGLKTRFVLAYPDYSFTDLKILDLLIWQLR
ncbi:hypothetical protein [Spirosoma pomorum]